MTVIQIGHENRLISFTFCSHFQRLFQIRKCFICPTLHWLNTRNRCLRKNVLIISGLRLRLIPTTDPSSGKQREIAAPYGSVSGPQLSAWRDWPRCHQRCFPSSHVHCLPASDALLPGTTETIHKFLLAQATFVPLAQSWKKPHRLVCSLFDLHSLCWKKILPRSVGKVCYSGGQTRFWPAFRTFK